MRPLLVTAAAYAPILQCFIPVSDFLFRIFTCYRGGRVHSADKMISYQTILCVRRTDDQKVIIIINLKVLTAAKNHYSQSTEVQMFSERL